ncbi:MAG: general secretion pathway protein GspK [Planctomycetes bacterium]|nr:general secretion pathway protein GspK [Planctomycetota bacterium]
MTSSPIALRHERSAEHGVALVLTLIFAILLYILVAELVVSGRMVRLTGENDALLARMNNQMDFQLGQVEDALLDDLAGAGGEEGGGGGLAGALGGAGASGGGLPTGGAGGEGEGETDPAAGCDSTRDSWFKPQAYADGDLTTYVWVEDENRKFNILALWSPDEEFARFSRDRLVRLIDTLREDTEFDVTTSDAEQIVRELDDWAKRSGTEAIPRPPLKSDNDKQRDISLPMHLDEMLMLRTVTEELFYDKVLDGKVIQGLESALTVWTALIADPGDPEKNARREARRQAEGGEPSADGGAATGGAAASGNAGQGQAADPEAPPPQPEGEGIRVNINTATRPVLRALFPPDKISDQVIDAILRYRNEVDEEAEEAAREESGTEAADFGDLRLGEDVKYKFFAEPSDLEKVQEFANLPDPELKSDFIRSVTTKSDVFSIHMATLYKRNEENRVYVLRRSRSIMVRRDNGDGGKLFPLVLREERHGLRVQPIDLQDEPRDLALEYSEMDQFAADEKAWNPFLVEFYLPQYKRDEFLRR